MIRTLLTITSLTAILATGALAQNATETGGGRALTVAAPPDLALSLVPALLEGFILKDGGQDLTWRSLGAPGEAALVVASPGASNVNYVEVIPAERRQRADVRLSVVPTYDSSQTRGMPIARFGIALVVPKADKIRSFLSLEEANELMEGRKTYISIRADNLTPADALEKISTGLHSDPDKIGIVSTAALFSEGSDLRSLQIRGCGPAYSPTQFAIKTGDYALSRVVVAEGSNPTAEAFVQYAMSSDGQSLVEEVGFTDSEVELSDVNSQYIVEWERAGGLSFKVGEVYRTYLRVTESARKLSSIMRFDEDGATVTTESADRLQRSIPVLKEAVDNGLEVYVMGFADSSGAYQHNLELAERRAQVVARLLEQKGITPNHVLGFGEEMPAACNTVSHERARNRRVELWVR